MARAARRRQLLETAAAIVRAEGTEALTLARLAERAGVTKPIAYEHFGTRAGLLLALYGDMNDRQTEAMRAAIETSGATLEQVATILAAAHVDWEVACGPEYGAIAAALEATVETGELLQSCRDTYIDECRTAFAPFIRHQPSESVLLGILGAAETLSHAAATGRLPRSEAVATLSRIMVGALEPAAPGSETEAVG